MNTENTTLPVNVQEFTNIMQTAPDVLKRNETSVSACNSAGRSLIDTIESIGGINSDELDNEVSKYLDKVKVTVKNMNERRKPLTQLLQAVSKRFTTLESSIDIKSNDSIPYKLQKSRDSYAAKKLAEQRKREEEARMAQALENEKASYRADITIILDKAYSIYVEKHISFLNSIYDRTTLENYNEQFRKLTEFNTSFNWTDFTQGVKDNITTYHMNGETRKNIKSEVSAQKKSEYSRRYNFELEELKVSLIERIPSKRRSLEEEEELRKQDIEAAMIAEKNRKRQEEERKRKEEEERRRQEEEDKKRAEIEKQTAEAQAAFDFMSAATPISSVKAKVKKKIVVNNTRGFVEIFQLWFMKEGINLTIPQLEKALNKMITFCEKEANKDNGEIINSAFVKYVDDVKAK